jgi:hypothetical protein
VPSHVTIFFHVEIEKTHFIIDIKIEVRSN